MLTNLMKQMHTFRSARPEVRLAFKAYYAGLVSGFTIGVALTFVISVALVVFEWFSRPW